MFSHDVNTTRPSFKINGCIPDETFRNPIGRTFLPSPSITYSCMDLWAALVILLGMKLSRVDVNTIRPSGSHAGPVLKTPVLGQFDSLREQSKSALLPVLGVNS